ncbi:MAG: hypothetical protein A2255_02370 [Candidatus Melainabacteria bacterium RIFOXYA2_FULL_32_9]|nr:MAG: hypothetical protein A2255_02370 [Candidatus Melainabacteria bacterium RIFOXYA2_FULL_32_9]
MKNISLITVNNPGLEAAEKTVEDLVRVNQDFKINIYHKSSKNPETRANYIKYSEIDEILDQAWQNSDAIIWFTATGIVVRKIAGLINSKTIDPAILVINLSSTQVIPLLSGHIGGANELAQKLTEINPDLTSFITTATDSLNVFAFDNFAKKAGFEIGNIEKLAKISNSLINGHTINLVTYPKIFEYLKNEGLDGSKIEFHNCLNETNLVNNGYPTVILSPFNDTNQEVFKIRIRPIILGIGLNRDTPLEELESDIKNFLNEYKLNFEDIKIIASFDAKKDEEALQLFSKKYKIELAFFDKDEINQLNQDFSKSKAEEFFNIKGVAEPTAVLAAPFKTLFIKKKVYKNTTIAAAF